MSDTVNKALIKDDIYQAVNGEWLKDAKIPADHSSTGGFMDLVDGIEKTLRSDFKALSAGEWEPANAEMAEFKKFYQLVFDFKQREAAGATPLKPILKRIEDLDSYKDLDDQLTDWMLSGLPLPFNFDIEADMKNAKVNALFSGAPSLILPDKTYYQPDNKSAKQLMQIYTTMARQLLEKVGYSADEAEAMVEEAKHYDAQIAPNVKSAEENADIAKIYNPKQFTDFAKATDKVDFVKAVTELVGETPDQIIDTEPEYFDFLKDLMDDNNFNLMKSWMIVKTVISYSNLLSEELRVLGGTYRRALSGQKEPASQDKAAYHLATGTFSQVVGDYYGKKYFGEKAKQDVHNMVVKMINVYKKRLTDNDWLGEETRKQAIVKLNSLLIQVGYPDAIDPIFKQYKVDTAADGGTLISNLEKFGKITTKDQFSKWNKPVERAKWEMSADTVNAYYHPFKNIIVFPAAILQAPFYSLDQSSSENFGGIGAVIAHEISHAFDNNGSQFDEFGNMNNWWTKEDHEHFDQLAQKMIKEFDGLPFAGGKVNGKLTVSENIADAGGLSCAEEAAKAEADCDLQKFFINWARIWRNKSTEQREQLLLSIDVHAPAELRATVQVKNLADFYTTFDVKPGDGMYMDPDDRVNIW
ncbi:M13 family metallopeptidase [Lactobacillus sp. Sy-1]|uniref:M13 family metallopeptidase n=1 Tax=Lactobacillus sp. Sy-1 TaxID=2109645 RepID=UPI001C55DDBA|nr:M13-type metalloendopeptidase [Lactobacillus sp. Sy-1]MBW1605212.1 M13 family peptidase [Lactobacillus sp. Sy-1]